MHCGVCASSCPPVRPSCRCSCNKSPRGLQAVKLTTTCNKECAAAPVLHEPATCAHAPGRADGEAPCRAAVQAGAVPLLIRALQPARCSIGRVQALLVRCQPRLGLLPCRLLASDFDPPCERRSHKCATMSSRRDLCVSVDLHSTASDASAAAVTDRKSTRLNSSHW